MSSIFFSAGALSLLFLSSCGKKESDPASTAPQPSEIAFTPATFLPPDIANILSTSWAHYKTTMIASDGRPLGDPDIGDIDKDGDKKEKITVSETVSYVLPRAEVMNDKTVFDSVWLWAKNNMQRENITSTYNPSKNERVNFFPHLQDHLFAWRWTPSTGGEKGGVLSSYDFNPSTDADQDIAAALLMADKRWGSTGRINYLAEALAIMGDIFEKEVLTIGNEYYLLSGDKQFFTYDPFDGSRTHAINPSYLRPSYYGGMFRNADPHHLWIDLLPTAHWQMKKTAGATMHDEAADPVIGRHGIIPDFAAIDEQKSIHDLGFEQGDHSQKDYFAGGDAFRIHYWMAVQALSNPNDTVAQEYFSQSNPLYKFFNQELTSRGTIYSAYRIDGQPEWETESLQSLAGYMLFFWMSGDTSSANLISDKITKSYNSDGYWGPTNDEYYAQNWVWFAYQLMAKGPTN